MNCDIAIIGAGPSGLCMARALAESGLNIVLIERQNEASLGNFDGDLSQLGGQSKPA